MTTENIEDIKSKIDIIDVIGDYVKLKKQGANFIGLCPFHSEKTGSFTVSKAKGIYKCFGCGESGDAIQFLINHNKISFLESVSILAKKYGVELDGDYKKDFIKPVARLEKLSSKSLQWFENERKISNDTLLRFGITEAIEWMPQFKKEALTVCFNYFKEQKLVNIKFRGPQKSFKLSKDAELIFYNVDAIDGEETIIIVEGEIDCLSMYEAKKYACTSVPNGTPPKNSKVNLEYLDNCWSCFRKAKKIILATDDDEVGRALREELSRRLGKERCYQVEYPDGCKDSNEVLIKFGAGKLASVVDNAKIWPLVGIVDTSDIMPTVLDWYENGYPVGSASGVIGFDNFLKFSPGEITTITGIPSHGKDEFLNLLMTGLAANNDERFGLCGFEEVPAITFTKLAEKLLNKSFAPRDNHLHRIQVSELNWAKEFISDKFYFFNTDEIDTSVEGIILKAIELVLRYGVRYLYINPWNWIDHHRDPGISETEYVSIAYSKLIVFGRMYGVHIFLVAHTTKMEKDKNTDKYKVPTLYSVSGSANFYNKTHNGVCVYRNFDTGITDIYIQKVKQSWNGQIGFCSYKFDTLIRKFEFVTSSIIEKSAPKLDGFAKMEYNKDDADPF